MISGQAGILAAIVIYLLAMVYVGFYFSKKGSGDSADDFYLGGRKLGPFVTAMSAEASDMSSWLLMGLPGVAYLTGIADAGWTAIGLGIGTYLNWLIVAQRLRRYSIACNAITIPDFFSRRFRDDKNILMCISALTILVFFIPYTASGFKAVGTLFSSLYQVNYHVAMIVGAVVIVGYTVLGGFLAVSTTDLIQSIVMTISLIIIVFYGIHLAGGWDTVVQNASSMAGYLSMTQIHDRATNSASPYSLLTIISTLAWGLGYFGMPHILLRFMAIEEEEKLTLSRRIASVWVLISMCVAILIGIIGYGASVAGAVPLFTQSSESETIIIQFANLLSQHNFLLSLIAGVVLAGILACTMSTADSQLLTAASGISQNFLENQDECKDFYALRPSDNHRHCTGRSLPRMGPEQLCICDRIVCMGRLRRFVWSARPLLSVLETDKLKWCTRRHDRRWRHGLRLEVPCPPDGRRLKHLRTASGFPDLLPRDRRGLPPDCTAVKGDL